jgi:hypothetical protein
MHRRVFLGSALASAGALAVGCVGPVAGEAPLASGQLDIEAMVSDDFFVYWTLFSGQVRRVSLDGGAVETLATSNAGPSSIAIDETDVYFSHGGTLGRVAKKGGDVTTLAELAAVGNLAVDDTFVYFTAGDVIKRVSKDGAAPTDLVTNEVSPGGLVLSSTLMWASEGTTGASSGAIREASLSGGAAKSLVAKISPRSFSRLENRVAWSEFGTGLVRTAAIDGSDLRDLALIDPKVEGLAAVLADDDNVYFATDKALRVVSLAGGGTPQTILTGGDAGKYVLASDATYVYAANASVGAIHVLTKALHAPSQE